MHRQTDRLAERPRPSRNVDSRMDLVTDWMTRLRCERSEHNAPRAPTPLLCSGCASYLLCEYRGHRYRRAKGSVRENCVTFAVRQNSPAECEAELTTCARSEGASSQQPSGAFAQQRPQLERAMLDCSDASAASWGDCDATFGEYSDCFDALTHAYAQYRKSLSCEQAPLDSYGPYFTVPTAPSPELRLEACKAFYARCLPED